jgi:general secretion pathway protein E
MSQTEVNPHRGLTFARALSSLLRQDPEVLLVGETRDPETARMAVEAGFTGHRVFTSMHVGEPAEVPRRLALMGVPEYLIGEALRGVVNQRLMRRLCPGCHGDGCGECDGMGYRGRFAVAEVALFHGGAAELLTPSLEEEAAARRDGGETGEGEIARVLGGRA